MTYSPQVLDHFDHPRNAGELESATSVQLENPVCGDYLKLWGVATNGHLSGITFKAKGCVTTVACASALTELVKGRPLAEVRSFQREELVKSLGGLTPTTMHASHLAFDTLQALLKQLK